jgi:hypothetical protein
VFQFFKGFRSGREIKLNSDLTDTGTMMRLTSLQQGTLKLYILTTKKRHVLQTARPQKASQLETFVPRLRCRVPASVNLLNNASQTTLAENF